MESDNDHVWLTDTNGNPVSVVSGALKTDGSAVTQPISAASLPLPTGAATAAGLTTLDTDLSTINANITNGNLRGTIKLNDGGGTSVTVGQKTMASSLPIVIASDQSAVPVSLGNTTGKSNVLKTGTLVTTATTADQVVLTYTVTAAKTFYVEYLSIDCSLTAAPTNFNTPVIFGTISMETPSGTKDITWRFMGPNPQQDHITFSEPIPVAAGVVIRVVVTPGITTSLTWIANFGGYER